MIVFILRVVRSHSFKRMLNWLIKARYLAEVQTVDELLRGGAIILCLVLVTGCFAAEGLAYEHNLAADYAVWAVDTKKDASIVKIVDRDLKGSSGSGVIWPMVFAYGWDDDFIIAKQHPETNILGDIDTKVTNWYIVQVATGEVYGPLTEQEFTKLRKELGVPDELTFTDTIEP